MQFITHASQDPWHAAGGEDGPQPHPPVRAHSLLTLEQWHAVRQTWPATVPAGITLANTVDIETLAADLLRFGLVVLHFPKWVDGRAYTQARLHAHRVERAVLRDLGHGREGVGHELERPREVVVAERRVEEIRDDRRGIEVRELGRVEAGLGGLEGVAEGLRRDLRGPRDR